MGRINKEHALAGVACGLSFCTKSFGWIIVPDNPTAHRDCVSKKFSFSRLSGMENDDLFDYFDPLLSPHAYPDGISPDKKPLTTTNIDNDGASKVFGMNVLGLENNNEISSDDNQNEEATHTMSESQDEEEEDLFDYFDPLKSPHEYPNGVSPKSKQGGKINDEKKSGSKAYSMNVLGMDYKPKALEVVEEPSSSPPTTAKSTGDKEDLFDYFDPLKSPHEYPNGISPDNAATQVQDDRYDPLALGRKRGSKRSDDNHRSGKVGILLMDHGSRNDASNKRLEHLAELYQLSIEDENIVVRAAHMEIASPSIADGLEGLLKEGVDEIVCHPYFLSPGRHVREDIPEIIDAAIASLNIDIPVITTDPVGSNTQLMIGAVHASVREKSQLIRQNGKS